MHRGDQQLGSASGSSAAHHSSRSRSRSPRRVVAGPSLPPGFQREVTSDNDDASSADDEVGPVLPTSTEQTSEIGQGTRIFLEREARRKEAQEEAARAAEKAANSRPDWMLLPPSLSNIASLQSVAGDPLSLKSRGFAQNTPRVSARGGKGAASDQDGDTSLWTETPQQRLQRLQDEAAGISSAEPSKDAEAALERELQAKRDQAIAEQVKSQRKEKSLVEEHQEKRRLERKEAKHKDRRHRDDRRDDERDSRRHSRHRSRSPDHRRHHSSSTSSRHRDEKRSHRHHRKREERHGTDSAPQERKLTRQEREDLDLQNGRMAAPSLWDRESALSVGGKLMDEKKRGKMLADASALGDRFGSGSRRFM